MKRLCLLSALFGACAASAFEVTQVFRPERFDRGNTTMRRVQAADEAAWVTLPGVAGAHGSYTPFVRFRRTFTAQPGPLAFDVSADERFVLLLDGRPVARGPHHGFPGKWYYESYRVDGLKPGEHELACVVYMLGAHGPSCNRSRGQLAFLLKAEGAYDAVLTTGRASWTAAELKGTRMTGKGDSEAFSTGEQSEAKGTGFLDDVPGASAFRPVSVVAGPVVDNEYGGRPHSGRWPLYPTERPDPFYVPRAPGAFKAAQNRFAPGPDVFYAASDAAHPSVAAFEALRAKGTAVTVPAHTELRLVWDLGDYYCAYPELETSGGAGARIRWGWAESLYDGAGRRADRGAFDGKRCLHAMRDTFLPDGRAKAVFTSPWWRCGRWCELEVKTGDAPLMLTRLAAVETRYPMEPEASFACDDPTLKDVQAICVRGLQNCMHEMYMDCPFFEQQMYPGDTRVQMLIMNAISSDVRLTRFGIGLFDAGRRADGMIPMNFPSFYTQDSSTYSMCWVAMLRDYARWHGTDRFLRARLAGMRHTLSALAYYENAQGLVEDLPGWSFQDWVPEWDTWGNAPDGRRGLSAVNNLLYVYALESAAFVELAFGETNLAAHWAVKARRVSAACVAAFWDESRGLVADTAKKDVFSEHAQCLALLTDTLDPARAQRAFEGLLKEKSLARTTVYFSHYLFDTYLKFGRADLFLKRLDLWRDYVKTGLKTPLEAPGVRARSDCHAWGAHPLYHLQTGVAGVQPDGVGFAKVRVAPQPGGLAWYRSTTPTPRGQVLQNLKFSPDGGVRGAVVLPDGLSGVFVWKGREYPLVPGDNPFDLSNE